MTPTHRAARVLAGLTGSATLVLAGDTPLALATPRPEPPGYNKNAVVYTRYSLQHMEHPQFPVTHARVHTVFVGGTPQWKLILIAAAAALLGAVLTLLLNGPALPGRHQPTSRQTAAPPARPSQPYLASASTAGQRSSPTSVPANSLIHESSSAPVPRAAANARRPDSPGRPEQPADTLRRQSRKGGLDHPQPAGRRCAQQG